MHGQWAESGVHAAAPVTRHIQRCHSAAGLKPHQRLQLLDPAGNMAMSISQGSTRSSDGIAAGSDPIWPDALQHIRAINLSCTLILETAGRSDISRPDLHI